MCNWASIAAALHELVDRRMQSRPFSAQTFSDWFYFYFFRTAHIVCDATNDSIRTRFSAPACCDPCLRPRLASPCPSPKSDHVFGRAARVVTVFHLASARSAFAPLSLRFLVDSPRDMLRKLTGLLPAALNCQPPKHEFEEEFGLRRKDARGGAETPTRCTQVRPNQIFLLLFIFIHFFFLLLTLRRLGCSSRFLPW